jgi:hypothetical protein
MSSALRLRPSTPNLRLAVSWTTSTMWRYSCSGRIEPERHCAGGHVLGGGAQACGSCIQWAGRMLTWRSIERQPGAWAAAAPGRQPCS